jgi:hypothetical protein
MIQPVSLEFSIRKAEYLLNYAALPGEGRDKQKFWREVMGFESATDIQEAVLAKVSVDLLQPQGQNDYGDRYQAVVLIEGPSGVSRLVKTVWIVLFDEDVARFVTATPQRSRRQS